MPLDKQTNVANIHHILRYHQCKLFPQQAQLEDSVNDKEPLTLEAVSTNAVSDDEQSEDFNQTTRTRKQAGTWRTTRIQREHPEQ